MAASMQRVQPSGSSLSGTMEPSTSLRHPCLTCQKRKVKCDRRSPCTRCLTYGDECRQPELQREPRRPARKSQDIQGRVRQLEESLQEMRALLSDRTSPNKDNLSETSAEESVEIKSEPDTLDNLLGHLIIDEDKSRYISTASWANFAWAVPDLGNLLDETSCKEQPMGTSHLVTSGLYRSDNFPSSNEAPDIGLDVLWPIYVRNADPVLKILHVPTVEPLIEAALCGSFRSNEGIDCLLAAIKFAAVTTMGEDECWGLGISRQTLLDRFRMEVHCALNTANFLTSENMIILQAFAIFLLCSRRHEQARAMWMLCGIAIRMAQALGLHRDGSFLNLSVFATELRRRLWWYIRELDILVAEECGFSPTLVYGADARLPLNINDADISSTTIIAPAERSEFAELTWPLIRFELCKSLHEFHSHGNRKAMGNLTATKQDLLSQSLLLKECKELLENKYFNHCSPDIPFQRMALNLGQRVLLKLSLVIQCPLFHGKVYQNPDNLSATVMDRLTTISCEIIESQHEAIRDPTTAGWSWILQTHIHWHPVAYLLNFICCSDRPIEQLQRAWVAVNYALEDCIGLSENDHRAIWKPLEKLLVKCRAKMHDSLSADGPYASYSETSHSDNFTELSDLGTTTAPSETRNGGALHGENDSFPTADELMPFDIYQPFVTTDDFMTFNESWWNPES